MRARCSKSTPAANRTIKTLKGGVLTSFDTTNMIKDDLGVTTDTERNDIVGFVRGECVNPSTNCLNRENWKLGDIFRSATVTVGTPSQYYTDSRDTSHHPSPSGPNAFAKFRNDNERSTANGLRVILAGANDGQLHAFRADSGVEAWSFIPPNLRGKLKNIAHKVHPTGLVHQYFVDGPISVADIWTARATGRRSNPPTGRRSWSSARAGAPRAISGVRLRPATRASATTTTQPTRTTAATGP